MLDLDELRAKLNGTIMPEREKRGGRIGASAVGNECNAFLALTLRGFPDAPMHNRLKRIFEFGNMIEPKVIRDLREAGLDIQDKNPLTGKQFFYEGYDGHVWAFLDGKIIDGDVPMILEVKSMNKQMFSALRRKGVAVSHPHYMTQMQLMMDMSGMREALLVAFCKDNSEYEMELVEYDPFVAGYIRARIESIISGWSARIGKSPDDWRCIDCSKRTGCWETPSITPACRYCEHAKPAAAGGWWCTRHDQKCGQPCDDFSRFVPS